MGKAWKSLENATADHLAGRRINRATDWGRSDVDVVVPDFDFLRIDCKYRRRHAHHALIEEIREKYCKDGGYPVLVTKHHDSKRTYVTVDLALFGALLHLLREKHEHASDREAETGARVDQEGLDPGSGKQPGGD